MALKKTPTAVAEKTAKPKAKKAAKPASAKATKAPKAEAKKKAAAPAPVEAAVVAPVAEVVVKTVAAKAPAKKGAVKKTVAKKAVAKKPAAPAVKLTEKQIDFLKTIHSAGETGLKGDKKVIKTLESLLAKKVIRKAKKDKASGEYHYVLSKVGEKQLTPSAN
jgi:aminoglycoside phosphotransferase (APT) family kinase protein